MEKNQIIECLTNLRKDAKKRNFDETVDFFINLKDIDMKKADHQLDFYINLHHTRGKKIKVCALVGPELATDAGKACDTVVVADDFRKYQENPKLAKKLAEDHDYFVAQANIMAQVAGAFGRVLGPRNKMPNPKAGCIVPPKAQLKPLVERLQKLARVLAKKERAVKVAAGRLSQSDDELADNIVMIFNQVVHHLPLEKNNIKNALVKSTMGKPIKIS